MSRAQLAVLDRMDGDLGYPFRDIAMDCGLSQYEVRSIVRDFHAKGLTAFGPLYSEDEPRVMGSGYWLERRGYDLQKQMRRMMTWQELWALRDDALARIEARRGETACGLDGEATKAGIALKPNDINTIPQEGTEP